MSGHVRLENSRSSKIHGHPKKKTNQENEQPTMGVLPKCHTSSIKIPSRRTQRYYYDEDNDTPCYKDSLKIDAAALQKIAAIFVQVIQSRHDFS
jgi:hypothetical protein